MPPVPTPILSIVFSYAHFLAISSPAAATVSTRNEEVEVVISFPLGGCLPAPSEEQRRLHAHTDALRFKQCCCQPGPLKLTTMFTMTFY